VKLLDVDEHDVAAAAADLAAMGFAYTQDEELAQALKAICPDARIERRPGGWFRIERKGR